MYPQNTCDTRSGTDSLAPERDCVESHSALFIGLFVRHMETVVHVQDGAPGDRSAMLAMVRKAPYGAPGTMHDARILLLGDARTRPGRVFTSSIEFAPPPKNIEFFVVEYKGHRYIGTESSEGTTLLFRISDIRDFIDTSDRVDVRRHIVVIPVLEINGEDEYYYDAMIRGSVLMDMVFWLRPTWENTRPLYVWT